jgi:hypothetical protein
MYYYRLQIKWDYRKKKDTLNTPKRATTDSIQLPHLTDTQLYWMRKKGHQQQQDKPGSTPKPPPIYVNYVITVSPLI